MSPVDFPQHRPFQTPAPQWRWVLDCVWRVEDAFQRSKASGRAVDDTRLRIFFVLAIFATAFATLGVWATHTALFSRPEALGRSLAAAPGARADLVDREGRVLALDLTHYGVYLNPREVWDSEEIRRRLPPALPRLSPARLDRALGARRREYLAGGLTAQEKDSLRDLGLPGVSFEEEPRRVYPLGASAEHLIGFTDSGGRGLAGAEKALDQQIREGAGSGEPVQLALDLRVQAALQSELEQAAAKFQTLSAMGLVIDIHTGEILAMSSLPGFDPGAPGASPPPNHVAASVYELGSIFKAFTLAMGLDSGLATIDTTFDVHAPLQIGRERPIHDHMKGDTRLALWQVFTHSSNIGAAKLALLAGPDRVRSYFRGFGLFNAAPTELAESARPILPKKLGEGTIAQMAFGQGISVSPLALATGYTAVMNGGLYVPLTIRKIKPGERPQGRRVISEQTSYTMLQLMRMNVTDPKGSGHKADAVGLRVGGKTGSAQKPENGHYGKNNVSSFAAVFPTDGPISAKRYLVLITLDSPKATKDTFGFITGGFNAAPTAGKVIDRIAPFLGVQRTATPYSPLQARVDATLPRHADAGD